MSIYYLDVLCFFGRKKKLLINHIAFHFLFFDLSEANPVRNKGEK